MVRTIGTPPGRKKQVQLQVLPVRISPVDYARLGVIREITNVPIQEHVRQAIGFYLEHSERVSAISQAIAEKAAAIKERLNPDDVEAPNLVPDLLAKHGQIPVRSPAPRVISK